MKNTVDTYINKFLGEHHTKRRFFTLMLMLALLVSLAVYWRLKYTGIAMTNEVFCGLEEHTHTEDCYEYVLTCGLEEGEEVFIDDETLSGEAVSAEAHIHTDDCYEKVLVCGLPEHTHTVDCLTDHSLDETEALEAEAESDGSTQETGTETTTVEAETEISSDEPRAVSDSSSDDSSGGSSGGDNAEEEQIYELPSLTGYKLTDFIGAAESQIGYCESKTDYIASDEGERKGSTIYGQWYGNTYGTWDAMFISYCLDYAGISDDIFPKNSGAFAWYGELDGLGYYNEKDDYVPIAGDLIFFDTDDNHKPDRVGVVKAYNPETEKLTVIEGDFTEADGSDIVCENEYYINDEKITGFGHIPDEEVSSALVFQAEDSGVNVKVTAPETALPEQAELYVTLYDESRTEYWAAGEAIGLDYENTNMAVVDIAFSLGGEKTEPAEAVDVSLDISKILSEETDPSTVSIVHLAETEEGIDPVLVADTTEETEGTIDLEAAVAEFTVDSFSSFVIYWRDYDSDSNVVQATVNSYYYTNTAQTSYSSIANNTGRTESLITNIDSDVSYNTISLTSSNQEFGEFTASSYTYTLVTADVILTQNGSSITIEDALSISSTDYSNTDKTYTVTVTTASGTVTYTGVSATTINLYYSRARSSSSTELDPASYNSSSKVYWDVFQTTTSTSTRPPYTTTTTNKGVDNATSYIASVVMGSDTIYSVTNADSDSRSWSASTNTLSSYFPNANTSNTESGTLIITPQAGYYITQVVIACCGSGTPYDCQTWGASNAYDVTFSVNASGAMEIDVSSLYFSHTSRSGTYFILIKVAEVASPLYVQYDYGDIVSILGVDANSGSAFSTPTGWTETTAGNIYGTGSVDTDDTQYRYAYDTDPTDAGDWVHYANSITDEAKEEAAEAGYYFVGWYAEYYYEATAAAGSTGTYIYDENYTYTFGSDIYTTTTYSEGSQVALPTHVKLIAQWEPVSLTVTKTVDGLTGTEFADTSYTYPLTLQRYNETTGIWEDYNTTVSVTITGDGSSSITFSPIGTGTYRVTEDTTNIAVLTGSNNVNMYLSVTTDSDLIITADDIINGTNLFTYDITNTYSDARSEPLPSTGGATSLPYAAAFVIITGLVIGICNKRF